MAIEETIENKAQEVAFAGGRVALRTTWKIVRFLLACGWTITKGGVKLTAEQIEQKRARIRQLKARENAKARRARTHRLIQVGAIVEQAKRLDQGLLHVMCSDVTVEEGEQMVEVRQFEASEFLDDEETIIAYLDAAAQSGDPVLMQTALGDVAKARGMTQIAKETGVGRESLYKSLAAGGNPSFATIMKVVHALGGRIKIEPLPA